MPVSKSSGPLRVRLATLEDSALLRAWRNDPETRAMSSNRLEVSVEEHQAWLERTLSAPGRKLYVAEIEGRPVGTVRADAVEGATELSWTVAPEARGCGIGTKMVREVAASIPGLISARVLVGNLASAKIAAAVGMKLEYIENGFMHFRRGNAQ